MNKYVQYLHDIQRVDIIGDVHGCFKEFETLCTKLGYLFDSAGLYHPDGRVLVSVGDETDRGWQSPKVVDCFFNSVLHDKSFGVLGNHTKKLLSYWSGNSPKNMDDLQDTLAQIEAYEKVFNVNLSRKYLGVLNSLPLILSLDGGRLKVAHAAYSPHLEDEKRKKKDVMYWALYGCPNGEMDEDGFPVRSDWQSSYRGNAFVVVGHSVVDEVRVINNTANIDTGCVFGGSLTALRYPEMEIVQVDANAVYAERKPKVS